MNRVIMTVMACLIMGACANTPYPATSEENMRILVMGEDHSDGTFSRKSRVFLAVQSGISESLREAGYNVKDEEAITLDNFAQGRNYRTKSELVDIASSVGTPIDAVVIFRLYGLVERKPYMKRVRPRILITGVMTKGGDVLPEAHTYLPPQIVPHRCTGKCLDEYFVEEAKDLAYGLSEELVYKLNKMVSKASPSYNSSKLKRSFFITFEGFKKDELYDFESMYRSFTGYIDHTPTKQTFKRLKIYYTTRSSIKRLRLNLEEMLLDQDIKGRIILSGNSFRVRKW